MTLHRAILFLLITCMACFGGAQAQTPSALFTRLDRNKDGKLTRDEFSGPIFNQIDSNRDGVLTVDEDQAYVRRRPNPGRPPSDVGKSVEARFNIPFAGTDNPRQRLDLYLPKVREPNKVLPVVVFIHGGGWSQGDKRGGYRMIAPLVESGQYIGVSLGYRLSGEAIWPAQIHDCKAAIRWLRGNAKTYEIDPDRIGVTGTSAGGHLVAMLGVSSGVVELEGELGQHLSESSRVACVVDQFGPTELLTMGGWHNEAGSPESKLVGGKLEFNQQVARSASPITYVSKDDAPFLFLHGTKDPTVPFDQSERLHAALKSQGVESMLIPIVDGGHGSFHSDEVSMRMRQFFDRHLRNIKVTISNRPIQNGDR